MRSWTTRCILALGVACLAVSCSRDEWVAFESPNGDFKVELPAEPETQTISVKTDVGVIDTVVYGAGSKSAYYAVFHAQYPREFTEVSQPDDVLDSAVAGAVANAQGELLSQLVVDSDGVPGRHVRISVAGGAGVVEALIFYRDGHLYTAQASTKAGQSLSESIGRFLDSFALIHR